MIALTDGVTGPLQSMRRAMRTVLDSFEAMQGASAGAVDVSSIRRAREELDRAGTAFDGMEESIRSAGRQQDSFNGKITAGARAADGLWGKLKAAAAALGLASGAGKLISLSDTAAGTKARLQLIVDDGGSLGELEQKIMASAQRARAYYFDTASAVASMGANAKAAFSGTDEIIAFMEQINKQFAIGGASAQGQSAAMLQLTQAMAAGALRGEELNSILENAPGIARAIESYMGIAEGSIKQYAEQGLITAQVVKNAMFAAADETNAKFERMPKTWAQLGTQLRNRALTIFNPLLQKINDLANSERTEQFMKGVETAMQAAANVAGAVLNAMTRIYAFAADNWPRIAPIVWVVVTALGAYYAAGLIVAGVNGAMAIAEGVKAAATAMSTGATLGATAAQDGLNASLLACPLTWIIVLIIALAAAFMLLWDNCEGFRNFFIDSTKQNAEAIFWFYNNAIVPVYNGWLSAQKSMIPGIAGFCSSAVNLYYDMAVGIVGNVSQAVEALSGLAGVYNAMAEAMGQPLIDVGAIKGKLTEASSWLESQRSGALSAIELHRQAIESAEPWEPLDMDKVRGALDKWGEEASAFRFSGLFDDLWQQVQDAAAAESGEDLSQQWDELLRNTEDTAGSTAAMSDALDLAEEELAYLRDIAEREAVNRFTTASITVEQHNTNYVSPDTDLDGVMDAWAGEFAARLDISGEGVHA